jgi:hypothetical protein
VKEDRGRNCKGKGRYSPPPGTGSLLDEPLAA